MLKRLLLGLGLAVAPLRAASPTFQAGSITAANGGTVVASGANCTLVLAASGSRSVSGGIIPANTAAGAAGTCVVLGTKNAGWTMSVTTPNVTLTNGAYSMLCSGVTFYPASGTFPASGSSGTIGVGMTFGSFLAANCPAGTYSASITLKVANSSNKNQFKTATMAVSVTVGASLTLANVSGLDFGTVVPGGTSGTVVIAPAGTPARSFPGNVVIPISLRTGSPASFTVTGLPNGAFTISLATTTNPNDGAGHTLTLGSLASSPSGTGTLGGTGTASLTVGGTLTVGANQAAGTYNGSISVTVTYN